MDLYFLSRSSQSEALLESIAMVDRVVWLSLAVALIALYWANLVIYNIFFHPLSSFPGPFWARASFVRVHISRTAFNISPLTYGFPDVANMAYLHWPYIVRISPNELSFASVESWKAIYQPKSAPLVKSEFYEIYGSGFNSLCIGSERNPQTHNRMRKSLAAAFSTKALLEQEDIIQGCVNDFIEGIQSQTNKSVDAVNMTKWFEMLAFDILGEMAFGESFHCIENSKEHSNFDRCPLIDILFQLTEHLYFITILDNLRRYPLIAAIGKNILPHLTVSVRNKHTNYSRRKVADRLQSPSSRADFMSRLIAKVEDEEMDMEELTAHASTLVIAGGETVATFLAAVTYHLLSTPHVYQKLRDEIRGRYNHLSEITSTTALQLPYLQAVISEGLRIYPPGSQGFPRNTPPQGIVVNGIYVPGNVEVYTSAWTVTHDARYFHDPYTFKPERWLDPNCTDNKEASQPFSLGPRGCLGRNFAIVEMSLILCNLHFQFDAELVNPAQEWESASQLHVMWWKPNLPVRFIPCARND
ncbi:cytochrome P450 [Aspergillus caelatus]|uniref:Cytochrome P450 n=1 Tax=Aspergillus caelatus TaxID=61420 RepID=A0A5N6ZWI5_9EURO|nr:cytochrome P450 [Aspergillus caelatus]KAE8361745.1 cytochrome P450 [Aspergillus caelatus]